jgi:hypothetical protein
VHFGIPNTLPTKFDEVIAIVRKYSATPAVATELEKLKSSGLSQNMFPFVQTAQQQNRPCHQFARTGSCRFGSKCRFKHTSTPSKDGSTTPAAPNQQNKSQMKCAFCNFTGHTAVECRKRLAQLAAIPSTSSTPATAPSVMLAQEAPVESKDVPHTAGYDFALVLNISTDHNIANWVMDSGATCHATYDEADCTDVKDCAVNITAAGSTFSVKRMGTASVQVLDTKGRVHKLTLSNCLISPLFPYKLLSLASCTNKGHTVVLAEDQVCISNKRNDVVLLGKRDPLSRLFVLVEAPADSALLAKSYMATTICCGNCTSVTDIATSLMWRDSTI